ncbi:MAG: ATP-binding cassette domain-containing protein [Solirubrobacterales bacterium]
MGENGAGKTTLMRMLAGTMAPDAGVIRLDGKPVTFAGRLDGRRHGIGFVQQHYGLVPEMSGAENLMLGYPDLPFRLRPAWALTSCAAWATRWASRCTRSAASSGSRWGSVSAWRS